MLWFECVDTINALVQITGVNGSLIGMYYGVNEMRVEATCIYCTLPLPFTLVTTLVRLLLILMLCSHSGFSAGSNRSATPRLKVFD
jgi:hypothetical protein